MMRLFRYLVFAGLTVGLLGEVLVRLFIPLDPWSRHTLDRSSQHPYIRTDWVPGFERRYVIEGIAGQKGTMDFKINESGFRSHSMKTSKKPTETYRIFFLGGSTTEELYMPGERTFPFLVERELSRVFSETKFECINGGISGYLAADVLALLIYKVLYYEPDLVVVMLANNDLRYGTVPSYDPVHRPNYEKAYYRPGYDEGIGTHLVKILKRSYFLTLIKWRLVNRIFPPDEEKYKTPLEQYEAWRRERKRNPINEPLKSQSLDDFIKYLEEIIFIAKGHRLRLIFMTEPSIYEKEIPPHIDEKLWGGWLGAGSSLKINLSNEFLFRETNRFNQAIRDLTREHAVELIDLEKEIPKDLHHFYDDVHFTPQGAQRAAEVIASYLKTQPDRLST